MSNKKISKESIAIIFALVIVFSGITYDFVARNQKSKDVAKETKRGGGVSSYKKVVLIDYRQQKTDTLISISEGSFISKNGWYLYAVEDDLKTIKRVFVDSTDAKKVRIGDTLYIYTDSYKRLVGSTVSNGKVR